MPNMELLEKAIDDSGIPKTIICCRAGIERATLYNRLSGRGEWKASEIVGITKALGLTKSERDRIFLI